MTTRAAVGKSGPISFRYEAINAGGRTVKGTVKALTEIAAERLLIERGLNPQIVQIAPSMFSLEEAIPSLFKIKPRDVVVFSRQLSTLLKAGFSLLPALETLQSQESIGRAFKSVLLMVVNDIRAGISFSDAIAKHPRAFNAVYAKMIAVGEHTGNLQDVLNRMAEYVEKQNVITKKVGKALTYPMMVLGVGVVVIGVLMTVVMPKLMGMFTQMNLALPLPTRMLISLTNLFSTVDPLYFVIAAAVIAGGWLWLTTQSVGKRLLDRFRITAPVIGPAVLMAELARFCRTLSVSVSAGMSLQEILEMAPRSTNNLVFQEALKPVVKKPA